MRHRVTVTTVQETKNANGGWDQVPVTVCARVPAEVRMLSGRELDRALQIDPRSRLSVAMRYRSGVLARQTVVYHSFAGDRTLEIVAPPLIDEKDRSMELLCGEAP
jgi:SPP1 family predicted phage head-tail adaptor